MALIQHQFYDQDIQLGTLGQLLLQYVTAGMTSGLTGIQAAMARAAISGGVQGVVSGNFDIGAILTDVVFAGVSAYATSSFNLNEIMGVADGPSLLGVANGQFSIANITNSLGDSLISAGLTTAVYGGDFGDAFLSSFQSGVVNLAQADLQTLIGDRHNGANALLNGGEGSIGHVLEHAMVGCLAGSALGGSCEAGAAAGAISAVYAGSVDPQQATDNAAQFTANATLLGGLAAALASGGDTNATMIASGVAGSAFQNNYLTHAQREEVERLLGELASACASANSMGVECEAGAAIEAQLDALRAISAQQTFEMINICAQGPSTTCATMLAEARSFNTWADQAGTGSYQSSMATGGDILMPGGSFLGMDVDKMAVEILGHVQAGTLAPEEGVRQMVARLATRDGTVKIVGGVVEIAGVAICSVSSGFACAAAVAAAALGADSTIEGSAQIVTGEDRNSPLVAGMIAGGVDAATAQQIKGWLEIGAATLTVVNGVATIVKSGQVVATVNDYVPNRLPIPNDLPSNIHSGQQGKHIPGHNNFDPNRSPLNSNVNPNDLLSGVHSGQYPIVRTDPRGNPVVDFGSDIGSYVQQGQAGVPTRYGTVHYGNNGAHIVPANPHIN